METLLETLSTLTQSLTDLEPVLVDEYRQLSALKIDPVVLQRISDAKSKQLSTVAYYDAQRQDLEKKLALSAPYTGHAELAAVWHETVQKVKKASQLNQQSHLLLERHQQASKALQSLFQKNLVKGTIYGAKGQSGTLSTGRAHSHLA